jgi:hypothetical protein
MPVVFEERRFPLVEISFTPTITDDDVDVFCKKMRALARGGRRYASVFDTRGVFSINSAQRKKMADLQLELEDASARVVVVACIAFPNTLARGVVTAINWVKPPSFPQRYFDSVDQARAHAITFLTAEGLTVPP